MILQRGRESLRAADVRGRHNDTAAGLGVRDVIGIWLSRCWPGHPPPNTKSMITFYPMEFLCTFPPLECENASVGRRWFFPPPPSWKKEQVDMYHCILDVYLALKWWMWQQKGGAVFLYYLWYTRQMQSHIKEMSVSIKQCRWNLCAAHAWVVAQHPACHRVRLNGFFIQLRLVFFYALEQLVKAGKHAFFLSIFLFATNGF